jgi:exodeoxyribonuclease VII large subunit
MQRILEDHYQSLDWLARRLRQSSPGATVVRQGERLRNLRKALLCAIRSYLMIRSRSIERVESRLRQQTPVARLQQMDLRFTTLQQRLRTAGKNQLVAVANRLALAARGLQAVSPLATLERGYAIVTDAASGKAITDAAAVTAGSSIEARLAHGHIAAIVSKTRSGDDEN